MQAFFNTVAAERGPGTAAGSRRVLSGMFGMALRSDAIRSNPISA
jgi:hypothetical protein